MELHFCDPGLDYSLDIITEFQQSDLSDWWKDSLFHFYPQIDRTEYERLDASSRFLYLRQKLQHIYDAAKPDICGKLRFYASHWLKYKPQIEDAFSDAFQVDSRGLFNDLTANITLNPICPRYLESRSFDIFYLNSERGALGMSLHEMIHFFWFHIWNQLFQDDFSEYETPSLKWIFSEMAVEPIMRDKRLSTINPYFEDGCVYEYFYHMDIGGKPVLEILYEIYRQNDIKGFMQKGFLFCQEHEAEIRRQMK